MRIINSKRFDELFAQSAHREEIGKLIREISHFSSNQSALKDGDITLEQLTKKTDQVDNLFIETFGVKWTDYVKHKSELADYINTQPNSAEYVKTLGLEPVRETAAGQKESEK